MTDGATPTPALPRKGGGSPRALRGALASHGLILRGAFHPDVGEAGLENVGTVILIGNAGSAMWQAFAPEIDGERNPLDRWTRRVVAPIAERFGARAVYPFDPDVPPFQRWALRAEAVHPSPLGILIHPEYGLWHAYRAALLFPDKLELPQPHRGASPCESCTEKPCLAACPVGAFTGAAFDVSACASHLADRASDCGARGCHPRNACPVGRNWRYPDEQIRFHMAAFSRTILAAATSA